jgi:hypothetical protein
MWQVWSGKGRKPILFCGNRKGTKERAFASIQGLSPKKIGEMKLK